MIDMISPKMLEASNGVLLGVIAMMLCGMFVYLYFEWRELGVCGVYENRKAAIALTVFLIGAAARTWVIWAIRHAKNHGHEVPWWGVYSPGMLVIGTLVIVVGGICWLRVTAWRELPHWFWFAAAATAIAFGVGMSF